MKVEGLKITKILAKEEGTSKAGKEWTKVTFAGETDEEYNNLYAFDVFQGEGKDQVDKFLEYNKEGAVVNVEFNVQCREWQGKYFTSLSAWDIRKSDGVNEDAPSASSDNGLGF